MSNRKKHIDRGKLLKAVVEKNGISIVKLVKKAGYKNRASYYAHIENPNLSFDILTAYGKALNYNFVEDIPEISSFLVEEPPAIFNTDPETMDQAIVLLGKWKERYYQLLEKYMKLLEESK